MPDNSETSSHSGMAITFGVLTFIFAASTAVTTFLWNKERKKNIATNNAYQAAATGAPGSGAPGSGTSGTGTNTAAPGSPTAAPGTTQTKK